MSLSYFLLPTPIPPDYRSVIDKIPQGLDTSLPVPCGVRRGARPPWHSLSILQSEDSKIYQTYVKGYYNDQGRVLENHKALCRRELLMVSWVVNSMWP